MRRSRTGRKGDTGLRLLSLSIAVALFLVVRGERRVSHSFAVPLEARLPPGLVASPALPRRLTVAVSGPWARLRSLDGAGLGPVTLDLSRTGPGVSAWFVRPESLRLPAGVRVDSIYPSQGTVDLLRDPESGTVAP